MWYPFFFRNFSLDTPSSKIYATAPCFTRLIFGSFFWYFWFYLYTSKLSIWPIFRFVRCTVHLGSARVLTFKFVLYGFTLGIIGHTQYRYTVVIQATSIVGTYGISFLIILCNSATVSLIYPIYRKWITTDPPLKSPFKQKPNRFLVIASILLITITLIYGLIISYSPIDGKKTSIAIIQGNIDQEKKWDPEYGRKIRRIYNDLTLEAALKKPNLIVGPKRLRPDLSCKVDTSDLN